MTKHEKIAREFIAYLNATAAGATYYTTLPDAHYSDMDAFESDDAVTEYVNVEDTRSFEFGDNYKEDVIIIVTVACRKGDTTASHLNKMIDDVLRCIHTNKEAIQLKFHLDLINPTGQIQKNIERSGVARGVASIFFAATFKENARWIMDAKES